MKRPVPPILLALLAAPSLALPTSAWAQDPSSPRAFVTELYAAYGRAPQPDYLGQTAGRTFAPPLLTAIRQAQQAAGGEAGALDFDPICACQDPDGLKVSDLRVTSPDPVRPKISVALAWPSGETQEVGLDLVATASGWRVADVRTLQTPSLLGLLKR